MYVHDNPKAQKDPLFLTLSLEEKNLYAARENEERFISTSPPIRRETTVYSSIRVERRLRFVACVIPPDADPPQSSSLSRDVGYDALFSSETPIIAVFMAVTSEAELKGVTAREVATVADSCLLSESSFAMALFLAMG